MMFLWLAIILFGIAIVGGAIWLFARALDAQRRKRFGTPLLHRDVNSAEVLAGDSANTRREAKSATRQQQYEKHSAHSAHSHSGTSSNHHGHHGTTTHHAHNVTTGQHGHHGGFNGGHSGFGGHH